MGWHPSWFHCKDCNAAFLERHPKRCQCGSRKFSETMTEDMFHMLGHREHDNCTNLECDDTNNVDLYRPED